MCFYELIKQEQHEKRVKMSFSSSRPTSHTFTSVSPLFPSSFYPRLLSIPCSLRLCSKLQIQSDTDSAYFLETLAGTFMDVVQYNDDNRGFEVSESRARGLGGRVCEVLHIYWNKMKPCIVERLEDRWYRVVHGSAGTEVEPFASVMCRRADDD